MKPTTQRQATKRAEIAVRRHKALELKIAGHSDRSIARILDAVRAAGNQRNLAFKPHFTHLQRVFNGRGPDNTNCWQGWFMIDYGLAVS